MNRQGKFVFTMAHIVALSVLAVAGVITLMTGGILANRSLPLGLAFAAVAAIVFIGLWKSSKVAVGVGAAGMAVAPMLAGWAGAPVDEGGHLTTLLGLALLYAIWLATWRHRPWAPAEDDQTEE
ncbi:hypothetical protein [Mariniluteicoccus flavus]